MNKLLNINNLTVRQGVHTKLEALDLVLYESQVNVLIGESGVGKSLLIRALLGALPPHFEMTYDTWQYCGQTIETLKPYLGRQVGYISQDYTHSFNDHTTIGKQLIGIYRQHYQVSRQVAAQQVQKALAWVGLDHIDLSKRYRFMLSGGQLERVLIASVMMLEPKLIIADEPTAALDAVTGHQIMTLLHHLAKQHDVTLLVVTHNLTHVYRFSDYIYVMKDGHIVDDGDMNHFQSTHIHPYSAYLFRHRSLLKQGEVK
ncbi:ATP-binding cassette domain-containing protein [Staphylococcus lutrae]|uniref:Nickel import system ATP-binding protein NikD n=1 Tax=Staphylococcus lutrae TaxID=155085 RepID=A0AAC9RNT2_9STAP|nr:ATP-binding cassette domain-containing protein [Staphylococcus lutrae]ARJ50646.1 peptide ABC transporter ATP-binding protein [Staphylococcus lutrae]PNZ39134.1 ABC transporter ATP-binding protein [Staphylococcus lutrae]